MPKYSYGLKAIFVGSPASDGGMCADADLVQLGVTAEDTCELAMNEPEMTDIYSEENDDPEESIPGKTKRTFKWELLDTSPEICNKAFGGTLNGAGDSAVWEAPRSSEPLELSVRVLTKKDETIDMPRVKFGNSTNWKFSKKDINKIKMNGTVLTPLKVGVGPVKKYKTPAV
jgi:hypothetical protein